MFTQPGEKRYIETEKTVIIWKLKWITGKYYINEMVFDKKNIAYTLMCLYLKQKKCAWIEKEEKILTYRKYEKDDVPL